jgi:hypothetical protein
VSNFTSTYKRSNRPQQLANCQQGDYETDRDYLTRWCMLHNFCEGVVEQQAIMLRGAGMTPCCGRSFREICRPCWPKQSRLQIVMHWETHCSPHLTRKARGKTRGTTTMPGDPGSSIALITRTRGEMTGQIISMAHPKWRP